MRGEPHPYQTKSNQDESTNHGAQSIAEIALQDEVDEEYLQSVIYGRFFIRGGK